MVKLFANSGDPDQMPHSAASELSALFASYPFRFSGQVTMWKEYLSNKVLKNNCLCVFTSSFGCCLLVLNGMNGALRVRKCPTNSFYIFGQYRR